MKLYIMSDLHLEFSTFGLFKTDADVVVLAGAMDELRAKLEGRMVE